MVFIEERKKYIRTLKDKPKLKALSALLFNDTFQKPTGNSSEIDEIYYTSVHAIINNFEDIFRNEYKKISERKISTESSAPFIHDDFLIFILIIGVVKFMCDKEWLLNVIEVRKKISTTKSFENLLTGNFLSKENNQSLVLIFLNIFDEAKINDELLIGAYKFIIDNKESFDDDFNRIINYKAFDLIIYFKQPIEEIRLPELLAFEEKFLKKTKVFSSIVYNTIVLTLLFGMYIILQVIPEVWKEKINELNLILSLVGVTLLSNVFPKLRKKIYCLMLSKLGYMHPKNK